MNMRQYRLGLLEQRVERGSKKEFGTWEEGGPLIEAMLVDRQRQERLHYLPLPYWHKAGSLQEKKRILGIAMMNLGIAHADAQRCQKLLDHEERPETEK